MSTEDSDWRGFMRRHWGAGRHTCGGSCLGFHRSCLRIPVVRGQRSIVGHGAGNTGSLDNGESGDLHLVCGLLGDSTDWSPDSGSRGGRLAMVEETA